MICTWLFYIIKWIYTCFFFSLNGVDFLLSSNGFKIGIGIRLGVKIGVGIRLGVEIGVSSGVEIVVIIGGNGICVLIVVLGAGGGVIGVTEVRSFDESDDELNEESRVCGGPGGTGPCGPGGIIKIAGLFIPPLNYL